MAFGKFPHVAGRSAQWTQARQGLGFVGRAECLKKKLGEEYWARAAAADRAVNSLVGYESPPRCEWSSSEDPNIRLTLDPLDLQLLGPTHRGRLSKQALSPSTNAVPPHTTINWGIFKKFPNHKFTKKFIINLCICTWGEWLSQKNIIPKFKP